MMTLAELTTLKTDLNSKLNTVYNGNTLGYYLSISDFTSIANYYNTQAVPQLDLWRPEISTEELAKNVVMTEFVALTAVKQNGFAVYQRGATLDATNANVRNGFSTIFGVGSTTLAKLTALAKKPATYFESLFTTSSVCSKFGYTVSAYEVQQTTTI